jgi:hypothetical protein
VPADFEVKELRSDKKELMQDYNQLNEDGQIASRSAVRGPTYAPDYKKSSGSSKSLKENA